MSKRGWIRKTRTSFLPGKRKNLDKRGWAILSILLLLGLWHFQGWAAEKLKIGTAIRQDPVYFLPIMAAEEGGTWKGLGLEVEWVPFTAPPLMGKAVVARSVVMGKSLGTALTAEMARGLPAIIVAALQKNEGAFLYVDARNPIKDAKQLKGKKFGVTGLGAVDDIYARFAANILGIEKDVKIVATGGIRERHAALRTGVIDAYTMYLVTGAELRVRGEIREVLSLDEHRPKEWIAEVLFGHKEFVKTRPDIVRQAVKGILEGTEFIKKNRPWSLERMKREGYSEKAAGIVYDYVSFIKDGKIDAQALENIKRFLLDYKMVPRVPPVRELYTEEFTG